MPSVSRISRCSSRWAELTTTAVWMNPRNLPEPPSLPGVDEELPNPTACSLHFVEDGKSLIVSYFDHGIM